MNNDKIQQKLTSTIFKEDELLLDPGIFRILVIKFSTNTELVNEINHEDRSIERITILNVRMENQLNPVGNNLNETLVVSKIIHLFTNLPDPLSMFIVHLKTILFQFLWDGKQSKSKKTVVCKQYMEDPNA